MTEILPCFIVAILASMGASVGFYTATGFDGDEDFDLQTTDFKKRWPKPEAHQVMIFWWVRYYGARYIPHFWTKPLWSCLPCMGSFHSTYPTIILFFLCGFGWKEIGLLWPIIAISTVGFNKLITVWWR